MKNARLSKLSLFGLAAVALQLVPAAGATGLNGDDAYTDGPQVCGKCHRAAFDDWVSHGHSRKLATQNFEPMAATLGDGGMTVNPRFSGFPLPRHTPEVYNWDNVLFIIGASKHWKTRFVGLDGFILTENGKNQYNWKTGEWVDYHPDEVRPFDCGPCHTTGYRAPDEDPPGDTFAQYPGIIGDFAHLNVTCEACHGPGAEHAAAPSSQNITIDGSAALCGSCHTRGDDDKVALASGGFIRHHEQYPELLNSPHNFISCNACHDPHVGRARGLRVRPGTSEICIACHRDEEQEYEGSSMEIAGVKCQDCHMGRATKSARANGPYEGDVWTHLFRINTNASYDMFNRDDDGNAVSARPALSLEYACFRCHADADKAEYAAIGRAREYHTLGKQ